MNVEKVNINRNNRVGKNSYSRSSQANKVSFNGAIKVGDVQKEINQFMPKSMQMVYKLGSNSGELQDIIINAAGTGLIAPIFIKYNPLSKTDEDTRTYSAWRQPVSAVLAVATQGLITIPFDKIIKNMTNSGWFSNNYNRTAFKDDGYIRTSVKKNNPGMNKAQIEAEVINIKEKQAREFLQSLRDKDTIYFQKAGNAKAEPMPAEEVKKYVKEVFKDIIGKEEEELKRCQEIKIPQRIERSDFYRRKPQETRNLLTEIQNKMNSTSNVNEIDKFLAQKEKALKGKSEDKCLLDIVQELRQRAVFGNRVEVFDEMKDKVSKTFKHIEMYEKLTDKDAVKQLVLENLKDRKISIESRLAEVKTLLTKYEAGTGLGQIEGSIKQLMKDNPKLGFERFENILELVGDKIKTRITNNIKGFQRVSALLVAFAMLPVSCSLLNWVYPRFMDAVFPNLSSKKHSNEAHNYIEKANRNKEAK